MPTKNKTWLRSAAIRLSRTHFFLMVVYAASIVLFDMTHLMAPEIITKRSIVGSVALALMAVIWFLAHRKVEASEFHRRLIYAIILLDILVVGFWIFTDRGVASRDVILFAIPIISSAVLVNRTALFTTTILCIAAYFAAITRYDYLNPNELYGVELYGVTSLYSAVMLVCAALLWVVVRARK